MALTPKQEAFAAELAKGQTQAEAYRIAFPNSLKWKHETVWSKASTLASNEKVQERVKEMTAKAAAANEVTVERIVSELAKIAFGNKKDLMAWGPDGVVLIDSKMLDDEAAAMVSEVKQTTSMAGGSISLKTHDKVKALELLGRHVGMFSDKVELTGRNGEPLSSIPAVIKLVSPDA